MDVKVNLNEWNSLSDEQREQTANVIASFFKDAKIVGDPNSPTNVAPLNVKPAGWNPFCEPACNVAQGAAMAACAGLSGPAVGICMIAVQVAGDACRKSC